MRGVIIAMALGLAAGVSGAAGAPPPLASSLTAVEVRSVEPAGTYGGVAYVKVGGTVRGVVDPNDLVVGLGDQPKNAAGLFEYTSGFEIIAPAAGQATNEVIYVDSENRGSAISQGALGGFLQTHATSYARVQWQTGISPGVPARAQGVGLAIMRDFGRWLSGRTPQTKVSGDFKPIAYRKLMLGGISQSAWLVNTLIAEGFNVDPQSGRGVYDAAIAVDGVGAWLAINQIAADRGVAQSPYVDPNGLPLTRLQLMSRPKTDPLYIDVANYTDYYRLRASLTATDYSGANFRRYDWPSPHAVGTQASLARCNGGKPITTNPLRYSAYMRALVLGMEKAIGVKAAASAKPLPPSTLFKLGPPPPASEGFNALPGVALKVPLVDGDAWPLGGVRFPEAAFPMGRPLPASVPPAITTSINSTCGNSGGFQPLTADELALRAKRPDIGWYRQALRDLTDRGYLLAEDAEAMARAPYFAR
ncbi:hypothetical protein BH11PSE2_BH11PSE2_20200 [soil metagenome]